MMMMMMASSGIGIGSRRSRDVRSEMLCQLAWIAQDDVSACVECMLERK